MSVTARPPHQDSALVSTVAEAFGATGALAEEIPGFKPRAAQTALARSVASAIDAAEVLIAEAGTGIGKTFAYLVPAVLSGKRVLVSTGTRNLQDQLFNRDLPAVLGALGTHVSTALLKGRSNYVCHHHLARNLADGRFTSRQDVAVLHRIDRFARISRTGDRAEAPGIAEDAPAWVHATSTRENCLGQDCEHIDQCFVFQARRRALTADLVVINHHLFCADLALRGEGVSELLPRTDLLIFDEAHQLPEVATNFFGEAVATRQFVDFARDLMRIGLADAPDAGDWLAHAAAIEQTVRELRLLAGSPRRIDESELSSTAVEPLLDGWRHVTEAFAVPIALLTAQSERSRDIERLAVRGTALVRAVTAWLAREGELEPVPLSEVDDGAQVPTVPAAMKASAGARNDATYSTSVAAGGGESTDKVSGETDAGIALGAPSGSRVPEPVHVPVDDVAVYWIDIGRQGLALHKTPLTVSKPFRQQRLEHRATWVMTSATLSVGQHFRHFQSALGLEEARCETHESPFDFARQALLYVPTGLPEPRDPGFATALADTIVPLILANGGRTFVLCTSLRMVDAMAGLLGDRLGAPIELFVQGRDSREVLLQQYRAADCPVLIGSASFWEGVDVVGAQLSLVVIDKLPFAPPDDPIVAARARALRKRGEDPFSTLHLPHTAMALKQGAGRLIRSESDRGLLVVGDVRLAEKPYGRRLLRSLPPFARTRDAQEALAFILPEGAACTD